MTISLVAHGAYNDSSPGSLDVPVPSGIQNNDILILNVRIHHTSGGSRTISTPSGWTLIQSDASATGTRHSVYWKRTNGTESTVTVTHTGNVAGGRMTAYRGCVTTGSPIDASNVAGGSFGANWTVPSITPASTPTHLVICMTSQVQTTTDITGVTPDPSQQYSNQTTAGNQQRLYLWDVAKTDTSATGTGTGQASPSGAWSTVIFTLASAPVTTRFMATV